MRPVHLIAFTTLWPLWPADLVTAQDKDKDSQREISLVGEQLERARHDLRGDLKDNALKQAFGPGNKEFVAVYLAVTQGGKRVKEIKVYVTDRGQTGKRLIKVLDRPNDDDFKMLVTRLGLGS